MVLWRLAALLAAGAVWAGEEPVKVAVEKLTFKVATAERGARGATKPGGGNYPVRGTEKEFEETVEVVKLNNGLVEAWICPAYGARLLRARDLMTGVDYFRWKEGAPLPDRLPWNPGGVKASFPFFEHGLHLRQPAGFRVAAYSDGTVTAACDLRFTHHATPADAQRYGRYSDESLNVMVTLKAGSTVVYWRQRKENPNPTPRAERFWNTVTFPVEQVTRQVKAVDVKTGAEVFKVLADEAEMKRRNVFLFPARYVVDHGPTVLHVSPHFGNPDNWGVSHFAVDAPYGFVGVYHPEQKINRLRLNDPDLRKGPGAKIYTNWSDGMEYWGGQGLVFERPGDLRPAYEPVEFTHRFYLAQGIGPVSFANDDAAVSVKGNEYELITTRAGSAVVGDSRSTGAEPKALASGPVGPHQPLRGAFDGRRLIVWLDKKLVLDHSFPLDRPLPDPRAVLKRDQALAETPPAGIPAPVLAVFRKLVKTDPCYFEKENVMHHEGLLRATDAIRAAQTVQTVFQATNDREAVLSVARTVYRLGLLDETERLAGMLADPDSQYLQALVAWEKGKPVNFQMAGWESNYMRALLAVQKGDRAAAIKLVDAYLAQVPTAWRPRMARAYWAGDREMLKVLAYENPGSPEVQLVRKLLGEAHELDQLLRNNPSADEHLAMFELELTKGQWRHLPRYPLPR